MDEHTGCGQVVVQGRAPSAISSRTVDIGVAAGTADQGQQKRGALADVVEG